MAGTRRIQPLPRSQTKAAIEKMCWNFDFSQSYNSAEGGAAHPAVLLVGSSPPEIPFSCAFFQFFLLVFRNFSSRISLRSGCIAQFQVFFDSDSSFGDPFFFEFWEIYLGFNVEFSS